jgi:hypothetical protein
LLSLVIDIELPRQIANEKQKKANGSNEPNGALVFKQVACHVERRRDISNCQGPEIPRVRWLRSE